MKENKFRIYDKINKNMIYPSKKIYTNMFGKIVFESTENSEIIEADSSTYRRMDYVGKDSKGNDVFEGDILQFIDYPGLFKVLWDDENLRYMIKKVDNHYDVSLTKEKLSQMLKIKGSE